MYWYYNSLIRPTSLYIFFKNLQVASLYRRLAVELCDALPWIQRRVPVDIATPLRGYSDALPWIQRRLAVDIATPRRHRYLDWAFYILGRAVAIATYSRRYYHAINGSSLLRRNDCHGKKNAFPWQYPRFSVDIATFCRGKIDHLYQCQFFMTDWFTR